MRMYNKMNNLELAELLRAVAAAYEIKDKEKNKFRIIAYERAADSIEHLSSEAKDLWDDNKLEEIAGVGESISKNISEIFEKGSSKDFEKLFKGIPNAVFELLPIEGIGPKTAYKLVKKLNITSPNSIQKLLKIAKDNKISKLEGFGKDSQEAIIKSIDDLIGTEKRHLLNYAEKISSEIIQWMNKEKNVLKIDALGSLRRKASTVGDIDISVATENFKRIIDHFTSYPKLNRILEKGEKTASIILPGNIQVDLMVQVPGSYGSLLQHFTGSKHHNISLREYALKKGLSLSEYGIKNIKNDKSKINYFQSEEEFYKYLGMSWIPPELREDTGEIDAALRQAQGKHPGLPKLVDLKDIKSDLQIHSNFDIETSHDLGESSMQELIGKAESLGYEYIAFTEHNPSHSKHNKSKIIEIIKRKKEVIEKFNQELKNNKRTLKKVFNSLEIDILPDGSLPIPEEALNLLDFALVSIHSSFNLDRKKMTDRVIRGFSYPKCKIFAHPSARKLNEREGIELNWEEVFDFCDKNKKLLEINADPMRLDLPDYLVKDAIDNNIKLTLGTDSHHKDHMDNMVFGISVARRGWAEKKDIINTFNIEEFEKVIK